MQGTKVLHILKSNGYSGAESVVCTIIELLDKNNWDAVYCAPKGEICSILNRRKIKYRELKSLSIISIIKLIWDEKPQIVHTHDYYMSVMLSLLPHRFKHISHLHSDPPWLGTLSLKSILFLLCIAKSDIVFVVSNSILDKYLWKSYLKRRAIVIGNPIDIYKVKKKSMEYACTQQYDIGYLGRLSEEKDPMTFVNIVFEIKKKVKTIRAAIIGDGPLMESIKKSIDDLNLNEAITLYGFLENPYPVMARCRFTCIPSKWEGYGIAAVESLALGVPVLCSGVGGLKNSIDESCGLICQSISEYVSEFCRLYDNKSEYEKMKFGAFKRSYQIHNINAYISKINKCYVSLMR